MTKRQALKEAVKRWGKTGAVKAGKCGLFRQNKRQREEGRPPSCSGIGAEGHKHPCPGGKKLFSVGKVVMGMFFEVKGSGGSWDSAFARAEESERRDRERYAALKKK